jgi:hypothetical protein
LSGFLGLDHGEAADIGERRLVARLQVHLEGVEQHRVHGEVAQAADDVVTIPLITKQSAQEENKITTGISINPVGKGAPPHSHNCDEHVRLLSDTGETVEHLSAADQMAKDDE